MHMIIVAGKDVFTIIVLQILHVQRVVAWRNRIDAACFAQSTAPDYESGGSRFKSVGDREFFWFFNYL